MVTNHTFGMEILVLELNHKSVQIHCKQVNEIELAKSLENQQKTMYIFAIIVNEINMHAV